MDLARRLRDALGLASDATDRYFVTSGSGAVGPLELELVVRGVEAGKVPVESSYVRHESQKVWRALADLELFAASVPPPAEVAPTPAPASVARPDRASEALRVATAALVVEVASRCDAELALCHRLDADHAVIVAAHGPGSLEAAGRVTPLDDPAVAAGRAGHVVLSEPTPGPAGAAVAARMARLGVEATSTVVVPVTLWGEPYAVVELGRRGPFLLADLVAVEALVAAFAARTEAPPSSL